ncbi:MAG: hypothetical protein WBA53_08315 [Burkholderiaceae bacterium]
MAFLRSNHWLVAALLFALAAVLYLLGDITGAGATVLAAVFVDGLAWVAVIDGGSRTDAGEDSPH